MYCCPTFTMHAQSVLSCHFFLPDPLKTLGIMWVQGKDSNACIIDLAWSNILRRKHFIFQSQYIPPQPLTKLQLWAYTFICKSIFVASEVARWCVFLLFWYELLSLKGEVNKWHPVPTCSIYCCNIDDNIKTQEKQ